MSSRKLGPGPAVRPTHTPNLPRRLVGYREKSEGSDAIPRSRDTAREVNDARNRPASRIPLNPGTRRPSNSTRPTRPSLHHQGQSWGSAASISTRSGSHAGSSGSTASSRETALRPTSSLWRKPSNPTQNPQDTRNHSRSDSARTSSTSSNPSRHQYSTDQSPGGQYDRSLTESPAEIRIAHAVDIAKPKTPTMTIYPELDRYRDTRQAAGSSEPELPYKLTTHDLPPPTPGYFSGTGSQLSTMSGSPSTRFSESPGTGPYSRDTTPTSMSSQSPGLTVPIRFAPPRMQYGSPSRTRPPVTRRRGSSLSGEADVLNADPEGLAAVRESLTSSSSNSTVRGTDRKAQKSTGAPPVSPPPRKSSAHQADRVPSSDPARRLARRPTHPAVASPPPAMGNAGRKTSAPSPRGTPPVRPSRDGTPDMQSQLWEPVPVVHSNLSSTSLPAERRGSETHTRSSSISRSTTPSGQSDTVRSTHRRRPSLSKKAPARHDDSENETSTVRKGKTEAARPTRTPSPNVSTFNSRFPFFGRKKSAPTPEAGPASKPEKQPRKGPAAGTGHEGYGRLGAIRRRSSGVLSPARGSTSSQDAGSRPQFADPFLLERMNPVVISGGEVIENRNTSDTEVHRAGSSTSFAPGHSRQHSNDSKTSSTTTSSREDRNALWPSALPKSQERSMSRRPSESSDDGAKPTLALRRSTQRLRTSPEQIPMRLPKPINTKGRAPSPLTSFETNTTVDESNLELQRETSRGIMSNLKQPKKLRKRSRSPRRWNLFSRSQPQAKAQKANEVEAVEATVTVVQSSQVPYYAMMDSEEQEDEGDMDVMDVLRNAEVCDVQPPDLQDFELERQPSAAGFPVLEPPVHAAPPDFRSASPLPVEEPEIRVSSPPRPSSRQITQHAKSTRAQKQSRLPQVGRIPKVVSTRPKQPSPRSFSRPFNKTSPQIPTTTTDQPARTATAMSPNFPKLSTPDLTLHGSTATGSREPSASPALIGEGREFLAFSPRKDSTTTTSSSSRCSGLYTMADTTAVVPSPSAPLFEDEIWDEYNDLLGDMALKPPLSGVQRKGLPPPVKTGRKTGSRNHVPESPTIAMRVPGLRVDKGKAPETREEVVSSVCSCEDDPESLQPPVIDTAPATPFSISKFVAGYGERNTSGEAIKLSAEGSQRNSGEGAKPPAGSLQRNSGSSRKSRASSNSTTSTTSDDSPLAQVNLRVGSMTVSKWLTFGHVLFSPAREELSLKGSRQSHSVLVIDGLGNDDWSFYAAETYPGATFFNLSPRAPLPDRRSTALPLSPKNHYQIQYTSHLDKFPFGPDTFSTVVFRFPAAAPESHYRNVVSEARRVLRPGGYIELSILDVDLVNMGNRGRRTVRRLKERIHTRNRDTSLGSTADLMLRLLGRGSFVDVKSCRVGVPVASSIARTGLGKGELKDVAGVEGKGKGREQRSLAEMMSDDSELADEGIARMVSRVARWWYTRCYESAAAPMVTGAGPGRGIWDKGLLGECEEWGTSLKLMVCHARVPDGGNRVASI